MTDNTENKSELLSEETVYEAKYFRLKRKVIKRKGKTFTKDFIERNSVVTILPFTENGELYLEKQYRDAFGKELIELVAGNIENDTDPLESAKRELKEETGLTAQKWKLLATWELSANMNSKNYVFVATGITEGTTELDDDEEIEVLKLPFEQVLAKVQSGEMFVSLHVAALLLYDKLQREGKI